jgi:hypothetical protein
VWCVQGDQTTRVASHLLVYGIAFASYVTALALARGLPAPHLRAALLLALAWRLALVPGPPLLSDDVYRYVWEGRIQAHGGNPYRYDDRPSAPRFGFLRDAIWQGVNHKDDSAIYPPLFQLAARGVVAGSDSVAAMKGFLVVCEVLTAAVLAALLRRRGLPPERLLVLAWSPLSLVEVAGGGHNEPLGQLCLALSLLCLDSGRPLPAALAAALGAQAKILPGFFLIAWAHRFRLRDVLAAGALCALLVWPYADAGADLWRSLARYSRVQAPFAEQRTGSAVAALLLLACSVFVGVRRVEPVAAALGVVSASLLLAANVLPWYALWLLPLLVLRDAPWALLFTGTVGFAYLVYPSYLSGGPWHVGWDVRALEYLPCAVVALWSRWR